MSKESLPNKAMDDTTGDFERLYKVNQPLIYRFMFWRTRDEMLAQDLTSNVFEKAWRTRKSFTGGSSKAWLYRIARTTLVDHWRKKKEVLDDGTLIDQSVSDSLSTGEVLDLKLEVEALQRALRKLPTVPYEVVHLRFIEGLSARQTAEQLGLTEANVRVIQYRALKKLRKLLQ